MSKRKVKKICGAFALLFAKVLLYFLVLVQTILWINEPHFISILEGHDRSQQKKFPIISNVIGQKYAMRTSNKGFSVGAPPYVEKKLRCKYASLTQY